MWMLKGTQKHIIAYLRLTKDVYNLLNQTHHAVYNAYMFHFWIRVATYWVFLITQF
jgi:hypothetical protein